MIDGELYDDAHENHECDFCHMNVSRQVGGYHTALCTDNPTCPSRASYETPRVKHLICHPCWKLVPRTFYVPFHPESTTPVVDSRVPCPGAFDTCMIAMLALARQGTPA